MIFGKHINKYYIKYGLWLLLGVVALVAADYFSLLIPELYRMVINGVKNGEVATANGVVPFTLDFATPPTARMNTPATQQVCLRTTLHAQATPTW